MKSIITLLIVTLLATLGAYSQSSFYDFKLPTIDGDTLNFADLKNKKVMIVNVASKCGLTPQYEQLQALHEKYGSYNFIIIGFPANNFMNQEPGTDEEIKTFCTLNYGVTFIMMSKISVKGDDMHPLYQWLTQKELNKFEDSQVKWNFQKYLIDEKGNINKIIAPRTKPEDPIITNWIMNKSSHL